MYKDAPYFSVRKASDINQEVFTVRDRCPLSLYHDSDGKDVICSKERASYKAFVRKDELWTEITIDNSLNQSQIVK